MFLVLIPVGFAVVADRMVQSPFLIRPSLMATLWQVEAAVVGFGVALGLFGFEVLSRTGAMSLNSLREVSFPAAVTSGLAVLLVTGIAMVTYSGTDAEPQRRWIDILAVGEAAVWLAVLAVALSDIVRVSNPRFRTERLADELRRLTSSTAQRQLMDRAAILTLTSLAERSGSKWTPWLSLERAEDELHIVRTSTSGTLVDADLWRIRIALERSARFNQPIEFSFRLGSTYVKDQAIARAAGPIDAMSRDLVRDSLRLESSNSLRETEGVISQLRDDAKRVLGTDEVTLDATLQAYGDSLAAYAEAWTAYVDVVGSEEVDEPFGGISTPVAQIRRAIFELMESAVAADARQACLSIGYFPIAVATDGARLAAPALFALLGLMPAFYRLGKGQGSGRSGSIVANRSWELLLQALTLVLPAHRRPVLPGLHEAVIARAEQEMRSGLLQVGRAMIELRDYRDFSELVRRWRIAEAERHGD